MSKLAVGDKAPAFRLPDQDGNDVSLKDYAGKRVIVYFYPKDDTPGCTKEACEFNDLLSEFTALGVDVIGVSRDGAAAHQKFRAKYELNLTLLTDAEHEMMEAYGAWGEKTNYGKTSMGVIRSTFVIDATGKIERAVYSVKADGHAANVLAGLTK